MPDDPEEDVVDLSEVYGEADAEPTTFGDAAREHTDTPAYVPVEDLLDDVDGAHEPLSAAARWEQFETLLWAYYLGPTRDDVSEALYTLEAAVRDGRRPTAEQVEAARRALDDARELVERHYADLAAGVEPWDDGVGRNVPYRVLREQLEAAGYRVEKVDR